MKIIKGKDITGLTKCDDKIVVLGSIVFDNTLSICYYAKGSEIYKISGIYSNIPVECGLIESIGAKKLFLE